jgi:hypothetical protein
MLLSGVRSWPYPHIINWTLDRKGLLGTNTGYVIKLSLEKLVTDVRTRYARVLDTFKLLKALFNDSKDKSLTKDYPKGLHLSRLQPYTQILD